MIADTVYIQAIELLLVPPMVKLVGAHKTLFFVALLSRQNRIAAELHYFYDHPTFILS